MEPINNQTLTPAPIGNNERNMFNYVKGPNVDENKTLKAILIALSVLICILTIANIAVAIYHHNMPNESSQSESTTDPEDEFEAKIQELFEQDPIDVEAINKLYDERIEAYITNKEYGKASDLISHRTKRFIEKNLKREALDALTKIDFSVFEKKDREYHYSTIVSLAKELEDNETADKYSKLLEEEKNQENGQSETVPSTQTPSTESVTAPDESEIEYEYIEYDDTEYDDTEYDDTEDWEDEDWEDEDWEDEDWEDEDWEDEEMDEWSWDEENS